MPSSEYGGDLIITAHNFPIEVSPDFPLRKKWWGLKDSNNLFSLCFKIPISEKVKVKFNLPYHLKYFWFLTLIPEVLPEIANQTAFTKDPFGNQPIEILGVPSNFLPDDHNLTIEQGHIDHGLNQILSVMMEEADGSNLVSNEVLSATNASLAPGIVVLLIHGTNRNQGGEFLLSSPAGGVVELTDVLKNLPDFLVNQIGIELSKDVGLVHLRVCNPRHIKDKTLLKRENEPDYLEVIRDAYRSTIPPQEINISGGNTSIEAERYLHDEGGVYRVIEVVRLLENSLPVPLVYALSRINYDQSLGRAITYPDGRTVIS